MTDLECANKPELVDSDGESDIFGLVKFYNEGRGYGHVTIMNQQARTAFLHCSILQRDKMPIPAEGDKIRCEIHMKDRGPEVVKVYEVIPRMRNDNGRRFRDENDNIVGEPGPEVEGSVKFFSFEKGYGFLASDQGDVFIHISTLARSNIAGLNQGDVVICETVKTQRGLQASKAYMKS